MVKDKIRKTGISLIGDVQWGTHFCLFYQTKKDLIDILVPYFKTGLENNEFCMWVTSEPLNVGDAKKVLKRAVKNLDEYIEKGQIEILDYSQWYTKSGKFEPDKVLQGWVEKENQALKKGFDGLRLTGNTFWLEKEDWKAFADYEATVDNVIGEHRMVAICGYSLDKCGASEIIDVVSSHQFALIRREGKWETIESGERKRAEEALRESEERYRTLTEFANDCIAVSQGGKTVYRNKAYERLIGCTVEETLDRLSIDTVTPEDRERVREYHNRRIKGKDAPEQYEAEILTKDGRRVTLEIKDSLIEYQGHPAIMMVARDITERKRAEVEKRRLEKQLLQSQKMQAIGAFASGISHDFNNIIAAIISNAEMALDDIPEKAPARHELERIVRAGNRAKDLVKRILAFSSNGQKELKPFRVGEVVKEALKLLSASLSENIEVRQDIATGSDMVLGDPTEIYQVLINLCTNAADAMHDKGGVLEVNLTDVNFTSDELPFPDIKPGPYFRITISDTGHGMDRAGMERIFNQCYTTKGKGRGMGLQVVQKIVKNYGGAISVDSEVGRGTTFQVFFPKVEIGIIPEEIPVGPLPVGKEKILFVDDEKDIVDIMPQLLQRLGYNVVAKTNSIEALEIFHSQSHEFDLIITDQTMPHMTGVKLARGAVKIRPDIPIILYTGFSDKTTLKKAEAVGIREVLFKPISIRDMAVTIRRVLDGE